MTIHCINASNVYPHVKRVYHRQNALHVYHHIIIIISIKNVKVNVPINIMKMTIEKYVKNVYTHVINALIIFNVLVVGMVSCKNIMENNKVYAYSNVHKVNMEVYKLEYVKSVNPHVWPAI